jgi:hypothetical protein
VGRADDAIGRAGPPDIGLAQGHAAYDEFVGMLADDGRLPSGKTKREHLDWLPIERIEGDSVAIEVRSISHRFRDAISELFLTKETELGRLTLEYGVF